MVEMKACSPKPARPETLLYRLLVCKQPMNSWSQSLICPVSGSHHGKVKNTVGETIQNLSRVEAGAHRTLQMALARLWALPRSSLTSLLTFGLKRSKSRLNPQSQTKTNVLHSSLTNFEPFQHSLKRHTPEGCPVAWIRMRHMDKII